MAGTTGREGPLTWYQEAVWWSQYWNPPDETYPPMADVWYLPERPPAEAVHAVFAELAARHEVLRTSLPLGEDGLPHQRLHAPGAMPVPLRSVPLGELREDVAGVLGGFRRPGAGDPDGPRWRAVLGVKEGRVPAVAFAGDRSVMDGGAVAGLRHQFLTALRGRRGVPPGALVQPLARADHERSAAGRAKADAALGRLADVFGRAPGPLFTGPPAPPGTPRYVEASTRSPELAARAAQAARIHRVTLPSIVLAAFSSVLALRTGRSVVPIRSLCANRTTGAERASVLGLYQPAYLVLDLSGDPLMSDVVRRTWRESLSAYAHSEYPPDEFRETVVRAARGRGFVPEFQLDYDFLPAPGPATGRPPAGGAVENAEPPVEHAGSDQGRPDYALFQARVLGEELMLALDADTALVPRAEIDRLLSWTVRALFRLADASAGAMRCGEFGAAIGLEPKAAEGAQEPPVAAGAAADPAAERALREAFLTAHRGVGDVDLRDDYVAAGGRLRRVPRTVRALAGHGFGGLRAEHVETPVSLRTVAAALRREPCEAGR